jgi:putrescine transport system substrate-binding protein
MWSEITDRAQKYDPGNDYAVDYMWGTTGIGYNVDKMKAILGTDERPSWDVLFKPEMAAKFKDCGIYMLDSPSDVLPSVLAYLGLNPDSRDPADLKKAQDLLTSVRPYIRKFDSSNYISALAQGDICLVLGYSGDVFQAKSRAEEAKNNVNIGYSIPAQGAQMWFDMMAIPKDAPHPAEALEFINYIQKPEVIAKATNFVFYANGNKASQAFVDKEVLDDPVIYPPDDMMKKLFTTTPYDNKIQKTVTRLWTTVVTGQ